MGQRVLTVLHDRLEYVTQGNARRISTLIQRYMPSMMSEKVVHSYIRGLNASRSACDTSLQPEECRSRQVRAALYGLKACGKAAATPEVYRAVAAVLAKGKKGEAGAASDLIGTFAEFERLPPSLGRQLLAIPTDKGSEELIKGWGLLGLHQPELRNDAIAALSKTARGDEEPFNRVAAVENLATIAASVSDEAATLVPLIIQTVLTEKDPQAKAHMLPSLAPIAEKSPEVIPLLTRYLSYGEEEKEFGELEDAVKASRDPYAYMFGEGAAKAMYQLRWKAAEAVGALKAATPELIRELEGNYSREAYHENRIEGKRRQSICGFDHDRRAYTVRLIQAHKHHAGSQAALLPATLKLLRRPDAECRGHALGFLRQIGPAAAVALPDLEGMLDHHDPRENGAVFETLDGIGSPEALAMKDKYNALNPKAKRNKVTNTYDLPAAVTRFFAVEPKLRDVELHIILVEKAAGQAVDGEAGDVNVVVDRPGRPILLYLNGKQRIRWSVDVRRGSKVAAIWIRGEKMQLVGDIPESIELAGFIDRPQHQKHRVHFGDYPIQMGPDPDSGKKAVTQQYHLQADELVLDQHTPAIPFSPSENIRSIFNRE